MRAMVDSSPLRRRWLFLAAIFALYFAIACVITWPLITQLGQLLVGRTTDAMVHYWNGWWFQQALLSGHSPFQTNLLNYPEGVSLVTHNFALLNIMPWLLLEPVIGGIPAYNLIILLTIALCGWAMYLLASELLNQPQAAFIAGLIYMAWPFRLSQLDHPNLIATYWVPIYFLFLIRTLRRFRWLDALWAGIALALVGYTRWQLLIPVGFMTLVYLLGTVSRWRSEWRDVLPRLGLTALIAFLALLPPAVMLAREQIHSDFSADIIYGQDEKSMSTDLLAYLTPSKRHFSLKEYTKPLVDGYYADRTSGRRYPTYIGLSVIILIVLALAKRWRENWVWLLMALVIIGLAAGMVWRVNGQLIPFIPTLYKVLEPLQVARLMRIPERYVIFLAFPVALLAASGWQVLLSSRKLTRRRLPLTIMLSLIILFEYQSYPLQSQYTDYDKRVFEQLAGEPGDFAILNIPLRLRFSKEYMFEQTYHERPILQGHVSREPDNLYQFIEQTEWLASMPDLAVDPGYLMAQLNEAGVGYVVLSKYLLEDATWRLWRRHVPYEPYYNDDRYLVYATAPVYGRDLDQPHEIAPGLGIAQQSLASYCSTEQLAGIAAITWATNAPLPAAYGLQLEASAAERDQTIQSSIYSLAGGWPASEWGSGTVSRQSYTIFLPPEEAFYDLSLQLMDLEQEAPVGDPIPLGPIDSGSCTVEAGDVPAVNHLFGDDMQLLSYEVEKEGKELLVNLYWLGKQRPKAASIVFIHVTDPLSKAIMAQKDTMPLNWRLPTTDWKSGELVADQIRVPLAGLPAGNYELALGVYDEETGERLPITGTTGSLRISEDGRLFLPETVQIP